jgi:hypothetical protein
MSVDDKFKVSLMERERELGEGARYTYSQVFVLTAATVLTAQKQKRTTLVTSSAFSSLTPQRHLGLIPL